jgi:hypothetical protein
MRRVYAGCLMSSVLYFLGAATPLQSISGCVVDETGAAVVNAGVQAACVSAGPPLGIDTSPRIIAATRTDAKGHFELIIPRSQRSRVNSLFFDYAGRSGAMLSVSYGKPVRLVLRSKHRKT